MSRSRKLVRFLLVFGAALFVGSPVLAHTTIRDQATEGVTADNALKLAHTCDSDNGYLSVVAQSVVVPTDSPILTTSDGSPIGSLSEVITAVDLRGLMKGMQDHSVFRQQQLKLDDLGNVIGFSATGGAMTPGSNSPARIPFQFAAPKFQPTSCAKALAIKIAIADVCVRGLGTTDSVQAGKVNLWIPDNGSTYSTLGGMNGVDGIGAPATLTVNRNLTTNPLPETCGAGITVTVTPSPDQVNRDLPIPDYWE